MKGPLTRLKVDGAGLGLVLGPILVNLIGPREARYGPKPLWKLFFSRVDLDEDPFYTSESGPRLSNNPPGLLPIISKRGLLNTPVLDAHGST